MDEQQQAFETSDAQPTRVTFEDLAGDLVWTKLLGAAGLALRPGRVGIGFFMVALMWLAVQVGGQIDGREGNAVLDAWGESASAFWGGAVDSIMGIVGGDAVRVRDGGTRMYAGLMTWPDRLTDGLWSAVVGAAVLGFVTLVWAVGGGAISRMSAAEFCHGVWLEWTEGLAFARQRIWSLVGALLIPALLVFGAALALAIGGWALFNIPGLNVIGGVLYGLMLVGGLLAGIVLLALIIGKQLLVPAVAVEGTDAIDAVSRAYSYIFRPGRLLLYWAIVLVQGVVCVGVAWVVAVFVLGLTSAATGAWTGDNGRAVTRGETPMVIKTTEPEPTPADADPDVLDRVVAEPRVTIEPAGTTWTLTGRLVNLWQGVVVLLVAGYAVSFYFSASTLVYLAVRRINDGQDMHDLWVPGLVEGTLAEALNNEATGQQA